MRHGRRCATRAVVGLALVLALGACGSTGDGDPSAQRTTTGEVVDLGGGATIHFPDEAPESAEKPAKPVPEVRPPADEQATTRWRSALTDALEAGRREADALGGSTDAAIWASGWSAPVISGDPTRRARLWSMFKPIAALAALKAAATAGTPGGSSETRAAIELALRRSDNCAARRMMLSLQQLSGGPSAAGEQVRAILTSAGAGAEIATSTGPADQVCRPYLQASKNIDQPLAPGLQLGTSTWSVRDAVGFAHALASGFYGADGAKVQAWMRAAEVQGSPGSGLAVHGE